MKLFRVLFVFDLVTAAIVGLIFCAGLADSIANRRVDHEDLVLWPPLIIGIAGTLGGGWWLKSKRAVRAANAVLAVLAIPALVAAVLLLYLVSELMRPGAFR